MRFSKAIGALVGVGVGASVGPVIAHGLAPFMPMPTAEAIGTLIEWALPVIGVYFMPANQVTVKASA